MKQKISTSERKQFKATLGHILFYLEDPEKQSKALELLKECEAVMKDGTRKDWLDERILARKKTFIDQAEFMIDDVVSSNIDTPEKKKKLQELISQLRDIAQTAQRTFWDRLMDLFAWS